MFREGMPTRKEIIPHPEVKPVFDRKKISEDHFEIGKIYPVDPHITPTRETARYHPRVYTSTGKYEGFAIKVDKGLRHFACSSEYGLSEEGVIVAMGVLRKLNPGDPDYELLRAQIEGQKN